MRARVLVAALLVAVLLVTAVVVAEASSCQHNVARGETLSGIATRYGTTVLAIRAANPNTGLDPLLVGQTINVPCGGQAKVTPTAQSRGEWRLVPIGSATARCVTALRIDSRIVYAPRGWCWQK